MPPKQVQHGQNQTVTTPGKQPFTLGTAPASNQLSSVFVSLIPSHSQDVGLEYKRFYPFLMHNIWFSIFRETKPKSKFY